jgi:hypothetical protein
MASMSQNIVDLIGIFVDAMRTTETIISEVDNGDGSITITTNVAALDENDYIILGGNNYSVYDLNTIAGTFKINATFPTGETEWKTAAPYYYHGTPQTVNKEVDTQNETLDKARYPAVILWEVIRQDFDKDPISVVGNTARLTMSFLDTTNKIDWTIEEHYDNVIDKMEDQADRFISICKNHPYISRFDDYSYIKHFNWGTVVKDKGHVRYILDENLSGLNLEIALPIKKNCLNKYARLLPSGVPPLPTADGTYTNSDNSFTRLIAGGTIFTAPDISFTDSDGTVILKPANTDIISTPCAAAGTVFNRPPVTYGRSTAYYTGDDGWQFQNGTYTTGYEQTGNLVQQLDATDLSRETLLYNNQHGNKNRFTDGLGGTDWTNAVIGNLTDKRWLTQDHLTGLEWINYDLGTATSGAFPNATWKLNIANAIAMTIYGYSDYRIAAMHEMNTIIPPQWGVTEPFNNGTYMRQQQVAGGTQVHSCSLRTTNRFFSRSAGVITGNGNINAASIFVPYVLRTMT